MSSSNDRTYKRIIETLDADIETPLKKLTVACIFLIHGYKKLAVFANQCDFTTLTEKIRKMEPYVCANYEPFAEWNSFLGLLSDEMSVVATPVPSIEEDAE